MGKTELCGSPVVYNFGYERHSIKTLIAMLKRNGIELVVDVRCRPYSQREEYNRHNLARALAEAEIGYLWAGKTLGGDCTENDWRVGLAEVTRKAESTTVALMCMEADSHKCHRQQLAEMLAGEFGIHNINL